MDGMLQLSREEIKALHRKIRISRSYIEIQRILILFLLLHGTKWKDIVTILGTSTSTISRVKQRYAKHGLSGLDSFRPKPNKFKSYIIVQIIKWVIEYTPRDYHFVRSRWSCETISLLVKAKYSVEISRESIRKILHKHELRYRRPRPILKLKDERYQSILSGIQGLIKNLPKSEVAVFQDEVDINTNPKIGSMWMSRGEQATIETPGNNCKRYIAGSQNYNTGKVTLTLGNRRDADLFIRHLEDLRKQYRRYKIIHVICDNARFHKPEHSKKVRDYLAEHEGRIFIHYLPKYAPETNPIERVWWHLHDEVTRNHQCKDIDELIEEVFRWLEADNSFPVELSIYQ